MKYRYIIWDWNGTLLDDMEPSLDAVNEMLSKRAMPLLSPGKYREYIGVPIRKFYEKVFDLEKEKYEDIIMEWNRGYSSRMRECRLSAGAVRCLEYFRRCGCTQIIVSSSKNELLKKNVEKYGIAHYFDAVLGADDYFAASKIDRAVNYIREHGPGKILTAGDLEHDSDLAAALGADCVLLASGHDMRERLERTGATVIDSLDELIEITERE